MWSRGLLLGLLGGVATGIVRFSIAHPYLGEVARWLFDAIYIQMTEQGMPPADARRAAELASSALVPGMAVMQVLMNGIVMVLVGLAAVALWNALRPWYLVGAVLGLTWTLLAYAMGIWALKLPQIPRAPPPPDPPAWLGHANVALDFAAPLFVAYLIQRKTGRRDDDVISR